MDEEKTVILVDGYNTLFRVAYTFKHLTNNGEPIGVIFGYFKTIMSLWQKWPKANMVIAWESKSKRRIAESEEAIKNGVLTAEDGAYKSNRKREEGDEDSVFEQIAIQKETLFEMLSYTLVQQIRAEGFEADDVIGTLCKNNEKNGFVSVIVSSDKDFYQLLSDKTMIYDAMKSETWTRDRFEGEFGIKPKQWIDVGALSGDGGDNIIGVDGVGTKTALKLITEFNDIEGVYSGLSVKQKLSKREQSVLSSRKIVDLAYSLKKIDDDIQDVPEVSFNSPDPYTLKQRFLDLGFVSLIGFVSVFTRRGCC